jgi:hypothetical protein
MSEWMLYVYKTEQAPDMPMGGNEQYETSRI